MKEAGLWELSKLFGRTSHVIFHIKPTLGGTNLGVGIFLEDGVFSLERRTM